MISNRLATLAFLAAPWALYFASSLAGCGGTLSAGNDGGVEGGGGSGSSSGSPGGSPTGSTGGSSGTSSGSSGSSSGVSGSSGGLGDQCSNMPGSVCRVPPAPPAGSSSLPTGLTHDYALRHLYLGDTDRSGLPSADAWKSFGYDLDGRITGASSTDVCTLVAGSSRQVQVDGNAGIDNSWGSNIMPILETLNASVSQNVDQALQAGTWTQLFDVKGFDDGAGNVTSAAGLSGVSLAGATYVGGPPAWNLATNWPVSPAGVSGCSLGAGCPPGTDPVANAVVKFQSAYQTGGTFVNGAPAQLSLPVNLGGSVFVLDVKAAIVTFDPKAPGAVTNGVIAGVLVTSDLIASLQSAAGSISSSLCSGSAFASIAMQFEQTSDILSNGYVVSNAPGTTCNAISIGLGFEATEIAPPGKIGPGLPPAPNPCGDGG